MGQRQEDSESDQHTQERMQFIDASKAPTIKPDKDLGCEMVENHGPYAGRETIGPANSKNVSPNTPKGEEV